MDQVDRIAGVPTSEIADDALLAMGTSREKISEDMVAFDAEHATIEKAQLASAGQDQKHEHLQLVRLRDDDPSNPSWWQRRGLSPVMAKLASERAQNGVL